MLGSTRLEGGMSDIPPDSESDRIDAVNCAAFYDNLFKSVDDRLLKAMAKEWGISEGRLYKWSSGKSRPKGLPKAINILKLAATKGEPLDVLLRRVWAPYDRMMAERLKREREEQPQVDRRPDVTTGAVEPEGSWETLEGEMNSDLERIKGFLIFLGPTKWAEALQVLDQWHAGEVQRAKGGGTAGSESPLAQGH